MASDAARDTDADPPGLRRLGDALGAVTARGPAPVERWDPPYCGEIDLRIAADGTWFYEGTPIARPAMVALFASILRRDPERHVLVTPVERVGITVEDAPFVGVAMADVDDTLLIVTNMGDEVRVGADHPLRFALDAHGGVKPYVLVRGGLWARLTRTLALELLQRTHCRPGAEDVPGIAVAGLFFPIEESAA